MRLTDLSTGEVSDLRMAPHTFQADAGTWTERFVLQVASTVTAGEPTTDEAWVSEIAPNPASGRAAMALRLSSAQRVTAHVYDMLGRRVGTLLDSDVSAGQREINIEAAGLAPGAYTVRVSGEDFVEFRRMVVRR